MVQTIRKEVGMKVKRAGKMEVDYRLLQKFPDNWQNLNSTSSIKPGRNWQF